MRYQLQPYNRKTDKECPPIPELTDGFFQEPEAPADGMVPMSICTDPLPAGTYALHISMKALQDTDQVFLFTGRKQLRDVISLKQGEQYKRTFYLSLAEILPRNYTEIHPVSRLFFTYCTKSPENVVLEPEACYGESTPAIPTVFLCGDSTVTDQSGEIPYHPGACYASWGQALPAFLQTSVAVENQAHSGLTTETFRSEGHFTIVEKYIRPHDLCLFQFGHNDQKLPYLQANREYPENLRRFAEEIRRKKGIPILVTPLGRNIWNGDRTYNDLLKDHSQAVKDLAAEIGTPLIDLHDFSVRFLTEHGMEESSGYFHPGDYTHTNEYGAYLFASFIARELHRLHPEVVSSIRPSLSFLPPAHLWDSLNRTQNRISDSTQKEQFDSMEKTTEVLLEALRAAKAGESENNHKNLN